MRNKFGAPRIEPPDGRLADKRQSFNSTSITELPSSMSVAMLLRNDTSAMMQTIVSDSRSQLTCRRNRWLSSVTADRDLASDCPWWGSDLNGQLHRCRRTTNITHRAPVGHRQPSLVHCLPHTHTQSTWRVSSFSNGTKKRSFIRSPKLSADFIPAPIPIHRESFLKTLNRHFCWSFSITRYQSHKTIAS